MLLKYVFSLIILSSANLAYSQKYCSRQGEPRCPTGYHCDKHGICVPSRSFYKQQKSSTCFQANQFQGTYDEICFNSLPQKNGDQTQVQVNFRNGRYIKFSAKLHQKRRGYWDGGNTCKDWRYPATAFFLSATQRIKPLAFTVSNPCFSKLSFKFR